MSLEQQIEAWNRNPKTMWTEPPNEIKASTYIGKEKVEITDKDMADTGVISDKIVHLKYKR